MNDVQGKQTPVFNDKEKRSSDQLLKRSRKPNNYTTLWYFLIAVFLFAPKANFIQVSSSYAGLKQEDLLIFVFLILAVPFLKVRKSELHRPLWLILFPVGIIFLHLVPILLTIGGDLFFLIRYSIYFSYIFVGWFATQKRLISLKQLSSMSGYLLLLNTVVSVLQTTGLIGGFRLGQYTNLATGRALGLYSDPNELAGIALLIFPIAYNGKGYWKFLMLACVWITVFLSDSRFSVLIVAALTFFIATNSASKKSKAIVAALVLVCVLGFVAIYFSNSARTSGFLSGGIEVLFETYAQVSESGAYSDSSGDLSLAIRIFHWLSHVNALVDSKFVGLGPGALGLAADSMYVRILFEAGVAGLSACIAFYVVLYNNIELRFKLAFAAIFAQSLLIDSLYFSRLGAMFWFYSGVAVYLFAQSQNNSKRL